MPHLFPPAKWLILASALAFAPIYSGAPHAGWDDGPAWIQVQAALASSDVKTYGDLCLRLSRLPGMDDADRKEYADVKGRLADFTPIDKYIAQTYQQPADVQIAKKTGQDMSVSAIHKRLSDSIIWKTPKPALDKVKREYTVSSTPSDDANRFWPHDPTWFLVYTDGNGVILGWGHSSLPRHFTAIIVNGRVKTVPDGEVSGAIVQAMATYHRPVVLEPDVRLTVGYKDGPAANRQGTLRPDQMVKIRNGMVFDVGVEKPDPPAKERPATHSARGRGCREQN